MTKNYYKILGISEQCTEQELKSAYRKLARKWHPDIAGNSDVVVSKFKEINEAYEILSDKVKRAEYDTINRYYNYSSTTKSSGCAYSQKATNPNNKKEADGKNNDNKSSGFKFNWDDFLSKYKEYTKKYEQDRSSAKNAKYGNSQKGKDISTEIEITIAEAVSGTTKVVNMLQTHVCSKCNGRKFVNGCVCPHCNGKGINSDYKKFTVKIPAGVKNNSKIRLAEEGEKGINGGRNGDLYITVHIKVPLDYKIEDNNIIKTLVLAPYEAVLGGNVSVKTIDDIVNVKISPNTKNGQKIRLSGCGINKNGKIGDMILTIEIQIPQNLSEKEIELYKQLKEFSSNNVR